MSIIDKAATLVETVTVAWCRVTTARTGKASATTSSATTSTSLRSTTAAGRASTSRRVRRGVVGGARRRPDGVRRDCRRPGRAVPRPSGPRSGQGSGMARRAGREPSPDRSGRPAHLRPLPLVPARVARASTWVQCPSEDAGSPQYAETAGPGARSVGVGHDRRRRRDRRRHPHRVKTRTAPTWWPGRCRFERVDQAVRSDCLHGLPAEGPGEVMPVV